MEGEDDLIDYYRLEMTAEQSTEEVVLRELLSSLSEARQRRFELIKTDPARVKSDYYKKFAPVYYFRRMRAEAHKGNRTVGWFAGARMLRRIADGNPRRFIQLMNDLFEEARDVDLTPKYQHRIAMEFCMRHYEACEGLPEHGVLLKRIVAVIGELLEQRVHGAEMVDAGFNFSVQSSLLENSLIRATLQLGIAYSIIFTDHISITEGLDANSELRLANMLAAAFWIPMRKGEHVVLQSRHAERVFTQLLISPPPTTPKESSKVVEELQLGLIENGTT